MTTAPETPTIAAQIEAHGQLLLPCPNPWCKSHDADWYPKNGLLIEIDQWSGHLRHWRVYCRDCYCMSGPLGATKQLAIEAWNTRPAIVTALRQAEAAPSADAAMVEEALRELIVAVTFADPPKDYGTPDDPNLCHEARIPVEFVTRARAALASRQPVGVPEGFVLVPREPTEAMLTMAEEANYARSEAEMFWSAMIAAAPATDEGEA